MRGFFSRLRLSSHFCKCIPWNYPSPIGNISALCDRNGAHCFDSQMDDLGLLKGCDCLPNCEEVRFEYSEYKTPIQTKGCQYDYWPINDAGYPKSKADSEYPRLALLINSLQAGQVLHVLRTYNCNQ